MHDTLIVHTACSRPQNLPYLLQSFNLSKATNLEWYITVDANIVNQQEWEPKIAKLMSNVDKFTVSVTFEPHENGPHCENILRNIAIDRAFNKYPGFYFCILDDDNILHPSFLPVIENYIERFPEKGYVYACHHYNEVGPAPWMEKHVLMSAGPQFVRPTQIDSAQYTVHSKLIEDIRFIPDDTCADGIFINQIFNKHIEEFKFIYQPLSYHNVLRPMQSFVPPLEIGF
jgi:hypothetical protein